MDSVRKILNSIYLDAAGVKEFDARLANGTVDAGLKDLTALVMKTLPEKNCTLTYPENRRFKCRVCPWLARDGKCVSKGQNEMLARIKVGLLGVLK